MRGTGKSDIAAEKRAELARTRECSGHTQDSLAIQLQVHRSTVARWERGETTPGPLLRRRLSRELGVSMRDIDQLLRQEGVTAGRTGHDRPPARTADVDALPVLDPGWMLGRSPENRTAFVEWRQRAGYTQESLAAEVGVARSTVMRWERGLTTPAVPQRRRLAAVLRVTVPALEELLGRPHRTGPAPTHCHRRSRHN